MGGINSVVESQPSKLLVAGSIPVSRSTDLSREAHGTSWVASGGRGVTQVVPLCTRQEAPGERSEHADVAQLAERVLGKDEVSGSTLVIGSRGNRCG